MTHRSIPDPFNEMKSILKNLKSLYCDEKVLWDPVFVRKFHSPVSTIFQPLKLFCCIDSNWYTSLWWEPDKSRNRSHHILQWSTRERSEPIVVRVNQIGAAHLIFAHSTLFIPNMSFDISARSSVPSAELFKSKNVLAENCVVLAEFGPC